MIIAIERGGSLNSEIVEDVITALKMAYSMKNGRPLTRSEIEAIEMNSGLLGSRGSC